MNSCAEEVNSSTSEVKVDSKVRVESENETEPEFNDDHKVKVEQDVKRDAKVKDDQDIKVKSDIKVTPEVNVEAMINVEPLKIVEDREFDLLRLDALGFQRSSFLKTSPTLLDTPHQKKAVRFADALGLDLESVRHIFNSNDPPNVLSSAMHDLNLNSESELDRNDSEMAVAPEVPCLCAWFSNPAASPVFESQVFENMIRLETCHLDSANMTVSGTIRVANIAYEKFVTVRFTTSDWLWLTDVKAGYVYDSRDGRTQYFEFAIKLDDYFVIGCILEFSVRLSCLGQIYCDSNHGYNYRIECCAATNR